MNRRQRLWLVWTGMVAATYVGFAAAVLYRGIQYVVQLPLPWNIFVLCGLMLVAGLALLIAAASILGFAEQWREAHVEEQGATHDHPQEDEEGHG